MLELRSEYFKNIFNNYKGNNYLIFILYREVLIRIEVTY
jgi:hypothetical protein